MDSGNKHHKNWPAPLLPGGPRHTQPFSAYIDVILTVEHLFFFFPGTESRGSSFLIRNFQGQLVKGKN